MTQFPLCNETASDLPDSGPVTTTGQESADYAGGQGRRQYPAQLAIRIVAFFRMLAMQDHDPFISL
jgi:hypothetical protein